LSTHPDGNPFLDFKDFNVRKGSRVGFEKDGVIFVGVVKTLDYDEETRTVEMTLE
jgi:hypothetical protein